MSTPINCFKKYEIVSNGFGRSKLVIAEEDQKSTDWSYGNAAKYTEFLEKQMGWDNVLILIPHICIENEEDMETQEVESFKSITNPKVCLGLFEKYELLIKAKEEKEDNGLVHILNWLGVVSK